MFSQTLSQSGPLGRSHLTIQSIPTPIGIIIREKLKKHSWPYAQV